MTEGLKTEHAAAATDEALEAAVTASLTEGRLPCPTAFELARRLGITRRRVGDTANRLKIRVINCQLGCFGVKKATHDDLVGKTINQALKDKVLAASFDGMLTCPTAFKLARSEKISPKDVCDAATVLDVKVVGCQLGCF